MISNQRRSRIRLAGVRGFYTAATFVFLAVCGVAFGGTSVTIESLTADLESKDIDRIDKSLNDVKRLSNKGQILPFIADLWDQRKEKHPGLPWDVINTNIVRVEIADILLQAHQNARIKLDPQPIHRFVVGQIDSDDPDIARKAIGALALVDDSADVGKLKEIATRKDPATFRLAVATLTQMCNENAKSAVAELDNSIIEPELKSYIQKRRHDSDEFKKRTAWCDRSGSNSKLQ